MELTQLKHSAEEVQAREHACSVEAACLVDARLVGHILCRGRMLSRCTPNGTHTHTLSLEHVHASVEALQRDMHTL